MFNFTTYPNTTNPSFVFLAPTNTPISAFIVFVLYSVFGVFSLRANSQIISSIIKCFMGDMVNPPMFFTTKNQSVHGYHIASLTVNPHMPDCIKRSYALSPLRLPVPLRKVFKIFNVYDCVLPLRQRDKAIGFTERLDNFMTLDFIRSNFRTGHRSTSNGSLLFSRHFNMGNA